MEENIPSSESNTEAISHKVAHPHFTIKTNVFEGPLDLLLNLVEKRKLFISDISLAKVTDDYIAHINQLPEYSLKFRAQFILIASTLLLIKAKSLLPTLELTPEEKTDIEDLEVRLRILELIRKYSLRVRERFGEQKIFERGDTEILMKIFAPGKDINMSNMQNSILSVINSLPKKQIEPKVLVKKVVSLEEMMDRLAIRIQTAMKMSFREFSNHNDPEHGPKGAHANHSGHTTRGTRMTVRDKAERVHVIVSFLAMLELVKQGSIDVRQEGVFDEIEMERNEIGVPSYV